VATPITPHDQSEQSETSQATGCYEMANRLKNTYQLLRSGQVGVYARRLRAFGEKRLTKDISMETL